MKNYLFHERLEFYLRADGINSTEAFEAHCKAVALLIDHARSLGLEINEYQQTDCTCWRVEANGDEVEVDGWKEAKDDAK